MNHHHNRRLLDIFAKSLSSHKLSIESKETSNIMDFLMEISAKYVELSNLRELVESTKCISFELNIETQKIESIGTYVLIEKALSSKYANYINHNLRDMRALLNRYNVVDANSIIMLNWNNSQVFKDFEGISYPLLPAHEYPSAIISTEDLALSINNSDLDESIKIILHEASDYITYYYLGFNVSNRMPCKYGISYRQDGFEILDKYYQHYNNFSSLLRWIFDCYSEDTISVQFNSNNRDQIALEFGIAPNEFLSKINHLRECDCISDEHLEMIQGTMTPDYLDHIVVKFKWIDSENYNIKLYAESAHQSYIQRILETI